MTYERKRRTLGKSRLKHRQKKLFFMYSSFHRPSTLKIGVFSKQEINMVKNTEAALICQSNPKGMDAGIG